MVLGKLPVPGRPTIWMTVGQGPIALAVGAGGCCLDIFTLIYPFFPLSPSLWETARYRLKYCLKGPLYPKQPTNQLSRLVKRPKTESYPPHPYILVVSDFQLHMSSLLIYLTIQHDVERAHNRHTINIV